MPAQRWDPMEGANMRDVHPFSRDRLMLIPRGEAAKMGFQVLHEVQQQSPEVQVAGVAVLFAVFCARHGLDPQEIHGLGRKLIEPEPFHDQANVHIEAMQDFARLRHRR